MKAELCDRCGERIFNYNAAHPGRTVLRIYIDATFTGRAAQWYEFHADCAATMTVTDILNGGKA